MIAPNSGTSKAYFEPTPSPGDTVLNRPGKSASDLSRSFASGGKIIRSFLAGTKSLIPGFMATALSVGMWQFGTWEPLENLGYNALFQIREAEVLPNAKWDDKVAVIAVDNASLKKYGKFPWSRDRYAKLLTTLSKTPPSVIGFDILFVDKSDRDSELAKAIGSAKNVVLATGWDEDGTPLKPLPEIKKAAISIGQISHSPDSDGISRRATIFAKKTPSLGLAMLQVYSQSSSKQNSSLPPLPELAAGKTRKSVWINWPGKTKSLPTYSFADVVEGKVKADALAGKIVLVGVTATGVDPLRTPLNQNPPTTGVYLHAAVIDNWLNSRQLQPLDEQAIQLLLLILGPATCWLLDNKRLRVRLAIALGLPVILLAAALCAFSYSHLWMPVAAPTGTVLLTAFSVGLRDRWEKQRSEREKQQLMSLFEKYLAPETANMIWQHKEEFFQNGELKAQEQFATVLFMDIRGFTSISERLTPQELFTWLNMYLDAMTECIMDCGGVVDKYIGDAIMAVFGVPFARTTNEEIRQDALNAIAASFAMHSRLQQLNEHFKEIGKPQIKIGIGIHTGTVMAGSLGGSRRLNYSVVGDAVNVAARLEALNKEIPEGNPYNLLVSSTTFQCVGDRYEGQPVKTLQLRGRSQSTTVYAIGAEKKLKIKN